jgi:hypothetical protein
VLLFCFLGGDPAAFFEDMGEDPAVDGVDGLPRRPFFEGGQAGPVTG